MNIGLSQRRFMLGIGALFLAGVACSGLPKPRPDPGSLGERIIEGNLRFEGTGSVFKYGCEDPTAVVSVSIGAGIKELDGESFRDFVNPVTVNAITDGSQVKGRDGCQKSSPGDKHDWPARGFYYPPEGKIIFTLCTHRDHRAAGDAFLVGDGIEGGYACYDGDLGDLMYEVKFSAHQISP